MKQEFRVVVAAVITDRAGRVLLAKRHAKDDNLPDFWSVPAGHVDADESGIDVLEANLVREVREEVGIEVGNFRYLDSHVWVESDYKKITVVFQAEILAGEPKANEETEEVRWFMIDEALKLELPPNVGRFLQKFSHEILKQVQDDGKVTRRQAHD